LLKDGWKRQTVIGEPRLSEIVQNYKAMGFEVHVEEFKTEGERLQHLFRRGSGNGLHVRHGLCPQARRTGRRRRVVLKHWERQWRCRPDKEE
jgi:hypothetical protein